MFLEFPGGAAGEGYGVVTAVVGVPAPDWELLPAVGAVRKEKRKKERNILNT